MKAQEFFELLDGPDMWLDELAQHASRVVDDPELSAAGSELLDAESHFRDLLEERETA